MSRIAGVVSGTSSQPRFAWCPPPSAVVHETAVRSCYRTMPCGPSLGILVPTYQLHRLRSGCFERSPDNARHAVWAQACHAVQNAFRRTPPYAPVLRLLSELLCLLGVVLIVRLNHAHRSLRTAGQHPQQPDRGYHRLFNLTAPLGLNQRSRKSWRTPPGTTSGSDSDSTG